MQTDDASFAKGAGALSNIAGILKGFALLKVGEGMMQLLAAMGKINEQQAILNTTSAQIGISTIELKQWQIMADMVGGSADEMASSLKGLMDITANLGRGITPDNQKFIDMMGILGVSKWQGVPPTQLATQLLDNAAKLIRQYQGKGDKVGEARVRNALDSLLGTTGNRLVTAENYLGANTAGMLARAGGSIMTTQGEIRGAIGPQMDLGLFNATVKESEALFAMSFLQDAQPALQGFNDFMKKDKADIIQTIKDLAAVFGTMTSGVLGFIHGMIDIVTFIDKLFHGKFDPSKLSDFGETMAKMLPKSIQDWANNSNPLIPSPRRSTAVPDVLRGLVPRELYGGGTVKITIEDKTSAGVKATGQGLSDVAQRSFNSGAR